MADQETRMQVEALRADIRYHRERYYNEQPDVTDAEFDALMRELRELEAQHPELVTPDSPTQLVGTPPSKAFTEVEHRLPMLSLDNAFSREELQAWADRVAKGLDGQAHRFTCELKVDGVAISLTYERGRLSRAVTRGSGLVGEDVTANVRTIQGVPDTLSLADPPALLEVRGEVYFPVEEFARMNDEREARGEARFANPRNASSGALRQKDPEITRQRPLRVICHGMGATEGVDVASHSGFLAYIAAAGLPIAPQT